MRVAMTHLKGAKARLRCDSLHRQQGDKHLAEAALAARGGFKMVPNLKMNFKSLRTRAAKLEFYWGGGGNSTWRDYVKPYTGQSSSVDHPV